MSEQKLKKKILSGKTERRNNKSKRETRKETNGKEHDR